MKNAKLGDLTVARIGLGAMGMSHGYTGAGTDDDESIRTIHRAIDLGVTFIDTAEIYGPYVNEDLVGRALKGRRDQVVLATKFGLVSHAGEGSWNLDSSPANIGTAVEGSLKRLGTDAGVTPAQVALAWLLAKGDDIAPIPGTRRVARLEENVAADDVVLTADQMKRLDELTPASGGHHNEAQMQMIER